MTPTLRQRALPLIDPEMRAARGLSAFNAAVVVALVLLIVAGVAETEARLLGESGPLLMAVKGLLFAFFVAEYALRLWVAPLNPRNGSALAYACRPAALLDLAVLVSLALPFVGVEGIVLRLVQLTRILRLARLGRLSRALTLIGAAIRARGPELVLSAALGMGLMLLAATALYLAEGRAQPESFGSIPRALWWAVVTLTTVGYGDVVPMTILGRVLAALTALAGIGIIALPTGVLAGAFSDALRQAREQEGASPDA